MIGRRAALAGIGLFGAVEAASGESRLFPERPPAHQRYSAVGMASWYGSGFHGRATADGEIFDMRSLSAAHRTMPLPSYARVTNLDNGYSLIVRVNDRGPYHAGRVMDVSSRAADVLGFRGIGTARIKVDYVGAAPMDGSDDNTLLASLRTDGSPAHIDGVAESTMVADNQSAPPAGGSIFAALFGGYTPPPAPPAPPPTAAAAPRLTAPPPPQPEAVQVAAAPEDTAPAPAPEPAKRRSAVAAREPLEDAPLPPPRPFDLGKARSDTDFALSLPSKAGTDAQKTAKVLPPKRPELHASAEKALYFSEPGPNRAKRPTLKAFDKVIPPRKTADDD